jgi:hypothetical protein
MKPDFRASPVFLYEAITASRRWQEYALRAILVLALVIALGVAWLAGDRALRGNLKTYTQFLADLGEHFYYGAAGIQLALALLAAPAATAGSVCIDRARGWLAHMFVTDLSDTEIVLGKLSARFASVLALVMAALPVLAIAGLLGGIIPDAFVVLTITTVAVSLLGCALAMALSVRASKTHEVLMVVFALWSIWLLSLPLWAAAARAKAVPSPPVWVFKVNPFVLAYAPYVWPGYVDWNDVLLFAGAAFVISIGLVIFTIRRLRHDLAAPGRESKRIRACLEWTKRNLFSWWPSPSLDSNPVLWREWHRNRPTRMARVVHIVFVVGCIAGTGLGIADAMHNGIGQVLLEEMSLLAVTFGLLILSATAPTSLTEERVRGSLDVLLATPLPTHAIVLGKWWANYRRALPLVVLPALTGLFVGAACPDRPLWAPLSLMNRYPAITVSDRVIGGIMPSAFLLAHAAAATSFGLLLATWLRRTGKAVAVSVGGFIIVSVGWAVGLVTVIRPLLEWWSLHVNEIPAETIQALTERMIALSPMGGQTAPIDTLMFSINVDRQLSWQLLLLTLGFVTFVALLMLGLTLLTFNRCLGRMNESPELRRFLAARRQARTGHGRALAAAKVSSLASDAR